MQDAICLDWFLQIWDTQIQLFGLGSFCSQTILLSRTPLEGVAIAVESVSDPGVNSHRR